MWKLAALCLLAATATATAQKAKKAPWEEGVSAQNMAAAEGLYKEGNVLFAQKAYGAALEKYQKAIKLWDHPLTRNNLAITKIRLDRIVEAADDLEAALRFGPDPFETTKEYEDALERRRLVERSLGKLEVDCTQRGTSILLDGKPWLSCPGKKSVRVLTGEHILVGEAPDTELMTVSRRLVVASGKTSTATVTLLPVGTNVTYVYPKPRWLPWTVTTGGVALGLGGVALWLVGRDQMRSYQQRFDILCETSCSNTLDENEIERTLADQKESAMRKGTIGITMMATGGAVAVGGAIWALFINRPMRVMPTVEAAPTAGGASASATWRF